MMQNSSIKLFSLVCLVACLLVLNACSFSNAKAKQEYTETSQTTYDIIIVPGIPLNKGVWDRTMKARVYWSKYLYDKGIAKNVMYSGSSVYSPYYEGHVMALYAEAIGIPKEHIFSETMAEHSTENMYYGYYKSLKLGFKKIALATDPFQAKSLKSFAMRKLSKDIGVFPIVYDSLKTLEPIMTDPVIDYAKAYNKDFVHIKDRESFWIRMMGTMGFKMDKKAYK
jgi:uncharacterized SAM-binding protein YcdF (DUF218 family)